MGLIERTATQVIKFGSLSSTSFSGGRENNYIENLQEILIFCSPKYSVCS